MRNYHTYRVHVKKGIMDKNNVERERLSVSHKKNLWKKWGPYVSERQWGTVREDYGAYGDPWNYITHDMARSNAYRWGEEGIAGFCDDEQILCLAPAFWNGNDPILKERLFGLTNNQGNHGEDVKELYFHLDSSPTHSYCKYLYKYPQTQFPYEELLQKNRVGRLKPEYELLDTGIFDNSEYFDCYIEYAKADHDDILIKITVINRSALAATIHVLPHVWFRNFWKHNIRYKRPVMIAKEKGVIETKSIRNGKHYFYHDGGKALFCDNETNNYRIYKGQNDVPYVKDGINNYVLYGFNSVNPDQSGTKAAIWYHDILKGGEEKVYRCRFSKKKKDKPWLGFDSIFQKRKNETDQFYNSITPSKVNAEEKHLLRSSLSGLLWTKQYYYYDVHKWLFGGPGESSPNRINKRNLTWQHLTNRDIISMPDKWEYPWYAAWDLAFHTTTFAHIDPDFAKNQLHLMLTEYYMHPNGQIPAYEWSFSDVNPPVHSWAVWNVYEKDKSINGAGDFDFLERSFQKLLINFTWWVNQKDKDGTSLFEGGFLGLDNIGVFDRNHMPKGVKSMQQADATSWMAMFAINMLMMSLELATKNKAYEESASKFFRHFLNIAWAMHHMGDKDLSLWDEKDAFYYDMVQMENGEVSKLKVRSLIGIIPLFAIEIINKSLFDRLDGFKKRALDIIRTRPDLAAWISRIEEDNEQGDYLFSLLRGFRLEHILKRLLDENEFLSDHGIRSLSKYHEKNPFVFQHNGSHAIEYVPGESTSGMFGGNSNWRGPIWFPLNYLIIQSLRKFYRYFGPTYIYEFPTGSGNKLNLKQIASELTKRLLSLFERDETGKYRYHNDSVDQLFAKDDHFKNHHLFYEFFHGENGRGLGASHQTGWTALIANLLLEMEHDE